MKLADDSNSSRTQTETRVDESNLLLVGVITYDEARDRHSLVMTRAWEQRMSKDWRPAKGDLNCSDRAILELLAEGAGSKQVARAISSNPDSAGRKIKKVLGRLGVESRAEAVVLATKQKWIGRGS